MHLSQHAVNRKPLTQKRQAAFIVYGNKILLNTKIRYKDKKLFLLNALTGLKLKTAYQSDKPFFMN
jgi:hypothetical protein